jgi:hypothetical protein
MPELPVLVLELVHVHLGRDEHAVELKRALMSRCTGCWPSSVELGIRQLLEWLSSGGSLPELKDWQGKTTPLGELFGCLTDLGTLFRARGMCLDFRDDVSPADRLVIREYVQDRCPLAIDVD